MGEVDQILKEKKQAYVLPFTRKRLVKEYVPVLSTRQLNNTNSSTATYKSTTSLAPRKPSTDGAKGQYNPITAGRNLRIGIQDSTAASYLKDITSTSSVKHLDEIRQRLSTRGRRMRSEKRVHDYNA